MNYQGFCIAEIGTNGTGKTRKAIDILCGGCAFSRPQNEKIAGYSAILILVSDDAEEQLRPINNISLSEIGNFEGIAKIEVDNVNETFEAISREFYGQYDEVNNIYRPVAVFVDDAMAILDTRNESVMTFFKKRRQHICDIIMNCHGASEYPVSLFKNTTDFLIFQTTDSLKNIEYRMSNDLVASFRKHAEYVNIIAAYGNSFSANDERKKFSYFNFRFNMKNPPSIENINKQIESKWWCK